MPDFLLFPFLSNIDLFFQTLGNIALEYGLIDVSTLFQK